MTPMCPNCKGTKFVEAEVTASDHPCGVLQCDTCGAVLGVIDFVLRDKIAEVQKAMHHRL